MSPSNTLAHLHFLTKVVTKQSVVEQFSGLRELDTLKCILYFPAGVLPPGEKFCVLLLHLSHRPGKVFIINSLMWMIIVQFISVLD